MGPVVAGPGTCVFDGELVVTTKESGQATCPGPADSFAGDQSIAVDVTVRRPRSCALMWFRHLGRAGYRLSACEQVVRLDLDDDGAGTTLTRVASSASGPGTARSCGSTCAGRPPPSRSTVLVLAACSSPAPRSTPSASPAAPTPTFADVSRGDTESVVKLLRYAPRARGAVVEPVVFLDGPAFCRAFRVPETDPRCEQSWVTEDSRVK